jgi:Flp pilus assembly protein TadD
MMKGLILAIFQMVICTLSIAQTTEELKIAKQYIEAQLERDKNNALLYKEIGSVEYLLGNRKSAVKNLKYYLTQEPNDIEVLNSLGAIFLEKEDLDSANVFYGKALDIDENSRDALYGISYILMENEEYGTAKDVLLDLINRLPKDHEALNNLALCFRELGDMNKSIKLFNDVLSLSTERANYYYNRGSVFLLKEEFAKAEDDFLSALGISSKNNYALGYMTILKIKQKKINEACSYFSQITEDVFDLKSYSEIKQCK